MDRPWTFKEAGRLKRSTSRANIARHSYPPTLVQRQRRHRTCISAALETQWAAGQTERFFFSARSKGRKQRRSTSGLSPHAPHAAATIADGRSISGRIEGLATVLCVTALDTARAMCCTLMSPRRVFDFGTSCPELRPVRGPTLTPWRAVGFWRRSGPGRAAARWRPVRD